MNANRRLAVLGVRAAAACAASLIVGLMGTQPAMAASTPTSTPTLQLDAMASATIANDEMVVVLAVERDGQQIATLNEAVVSQLNAAIAEARRVDGVRARLGSLSTYPNVTREGKPNGWKVRGELVLASRMLEQLSQLTGRLAEKMQLASVSFQLSSERRRTEENRLLSEAAKSFQNKATQAATAFGFKSYQIRELSLRPGGNFQPRPVYMSRSAEAMPMAASAPPPVPTDGGESEVVVSVSGTVDLIP
ncbi:MAG: SIMPL domain-containing protein [Burkholderiales bacterium]